MLNNPLANRAWLKYADEVRRDPTNLYYCARLLERGYLPEMVADAAELIRQAAMTVYKLDPLAYVTTFPHASGMLSATELDELTEHWSLKAMRMRLIFFAESSGQMRHSARKFPSHLCAGHTNIFREYQGPPHAASRNTFRHSQRAPV